jgi:hypothetical protein
MRAGAETGIRRHIVTEQHEHRVLGSMMPHESLDGRDQDGAAVAAARGVNGGAAAF